MIDESTAPYAALLLRIALGLLALAHAGLKVFVFTVPGFVKYFAGLGLPEWFAYALLAFEILGGAALIMRVFTRWLSCSPENLPERSSWCTPPWDFFFTIREEAGSFLRCGLLALLL